MNLKSKFLALERDAEIGNLDANGWRNWQDLKLNLHKEQRNVTKDLKHKSRIKWVTEGDENTNYFQTIVKGRKRKNSLNGIIINGV